MYAAHNPGLKAAVAWYGRRPGQTSCIPKNPIDLAAAAQMPGARPLRRKDQSIPDETIDKRQEACKAAGKTCEVKIYPEAPHGFFADYRPSYRADDAKDGWNQMLAWFKKNGVA